MQIGSTGFKVILLQARLNWLNYPIGRIDGDFGRTTSTVVKGFQKNNKMTVDGIAGRRTVAKLEALTKNAWLFYFIHCSATREGDDKRGNWVKWLHTEKKGWSRTGYPDVICLDGEVESLRPFNTDRLVSESEYTFGVKGSTLLNRNSIHLCYIGGLAKDAKTAKDTRTEGQLRSMRILIEHALLRNPKLIVVGHNQVQKKACPSFDVPQYLKKLSVSEANFANWSPNFRIR